MANLTIFGLTQLTSAGANMSTDLVPVWDNDVAETKKMTLSDLRNLMSPVNWSDSFSSATQATSSWTPNNAAANVNAAIVPKGTGAITAAIPDGTATGGNARGAGAVDLQVARTVNNEVASGSYSVVVGGYRNKSTGTYCAILGGERNTASNIGSVVLGGSSNNSGGQQSVIGGGDGNQATAFLSAVFSGYQNIASSGKAFIGGGQGSTASGEYSNIAGGFLNTASGQASHIGGGQSNTASGNHSVVGGGLSNTASNSRTFIGSGESNTNMGAWGVICGGQSNFLGTNSHSTICGGQSNSAVEASFVGGGRTNAASSQYSIIVGGANNQASGTYSFVGGGGDAATATNRNVASGSYSVVVGGLKNTASAVASTVVGGYNATASLYGQVAHGAGQFSTSGDAQAHELVWRREITGTAQTELFLDGASVAAILPGTNSVWNGIIDVSAVCTTTGNGSTIVGHVAATSYKVTIKRIGTTTSLVGTVQEIGTTNADASMATSVFTIDNNDTNESLRVQFTPPGTAGSTTVIRAIATFRGQQIQY